MALSTGFLMNVEASPMSARLGAGVRKAGPTGQISPAAAASPSLPPFAGSVFRALSLYLSAPNSLAVLEASAHAAGIRRDRLTARHLPEIVAQMQNSFDFFGVPEERRGRCLDQLRALADDAAAPPGSASVTVPIAHESDIVRARLAGRALCKQLGLSEPRTGSVVAAISELGRNIFKHAGAGTVTVRRLDGPSAGVEIVASDSGPGIADVSALLSRDVTARTAAGAGLRAVRDQADAFDIASRPGAGTVVTLRKLRGR